jgi:hypothetical protein
MTMRALNASASILLDGAGYGIAEIGPGIDGPDTPYWTIDTLMIVTSRPGQGPVPRAILYVDTICHSQMQALTYDGSFNAAAGSDFPLQRGQRLIVEWSGGQVGDTATVSVTGTMKDTL